MIWSHGVILETITALLADMFAGGVVVRCGIELEFYLRHGEVVPGPDIIARFSSDLQGVVLEKERGSGQYECVIDHADIIQAVVDLECLKSRISDAAVKNGLSLLLGAKPFDNDYGSAMHFHISLHDRNGDNLFAYNEVMLRSVITTLLDLVSTDLGFFCTPEDISRFQPGWMAPSHLSWGGNNRSVVIRIPTSQPKERRFEFRLPSSNTDPYKVVLFLLIGIITADDKSSKYPKIYGNAYDSQYNLQKLEFYNTMPMKYFKSPLALDQYVAEFSNYRARDV